MSPQMWDVWERNAREQPGREAIVHWDAIEPPHVWTRSALLDAALRAGTWLAEAGLDTGEVCALVLRHHRAFYPVYMGVSSLGAIPAVLAYPNPRLHPEKFAHGLLGMAERSGLDWIFTTRDLEPSIRPLVVHGKSSIKGIFLLEECERGGVIGQEPRPDLLERKRAAVHPSDPFLVQHSSGTTGLQKPVALSHTAVLDHVERYAEAIRLSEADKVASWLPLYHDMGLIAALHLPLALGVPLIQIDPFQWVTAPVLLFNVISEYGATLCWLPNFAYNFMADRIREEDMEGVRLDTVRMIINCSEPVRADSHDKFHARFSPFGLRRDSLAACYAMAETTFAATQTAPQVEAGRLCVDREAISRGIVALHLALLMLGVGTGDEVVVSTFTFAATANAVKYVGGTPVFIDSDPASWNMDPGLLGEELGTAAKRGKLPKAVIVVDLYGQCADYDPILEACARHGVPVIEDAAEALGASYRGKPAGSFGKIAAFSFNGNKIISTSGGGMFVSVDRSLVERARHLATQARDPAPHYQHSEIGYNYRMSNLLAAVGRGQLRVLRDRVAKKREVFRFYRRALGDLPGISFMPIAGYGEPNYWLTCIVVDPTRFRQSREDILLALEKENIESRPLWKPMHLQPVFKDCRVRGGSVSEKIFRDGLCLPSGTALTDVDLGRITRIIRKDRPGM